MIIQKDNGQPMPSPTLDFRKHRIPSFRCLLNACCARALWDKELLSLEKAAGGMGSLEKRPNGEGRETEK